MIGFGVLLALELFGAPAPCDPGAAAPDSTEAVVALVYPVASPSLPTASPCASAWIPDLDPGLRVTEPGERSFALIEAHLLEKYGPFRESLSSP